MVNLPLFTGNMMVYVETLREYTNILQELIDKFSEVAGYKINIQKSIICLDTRYEQSKNIRNRLLQ